MNYDACMYLYTETSNLHIFIGCYPGGVPIESLSMSSLWYQLLFTNLMITNSCFENSLKRIVLESGIHGEKCSATC